MSIKHAVLGLLSEQPMHGYRLKEAFDERVGALWGLTTGQIYQTLKALERAALLEGRGERVGARPARRIYSLTPQGTRALNAWLDETPAPWTRPFRAELLIRLLFLRAADLSRVGLALDREEQDALHLRGRIARMPREAVTRTGVDVLGLFLDAITHHLDADVKMLRRVRQAVVSWGHAQGLDVGMLLTGLTEVASATAATAGPDPAPAAAAARDSPPTAMSPRAVRLRPVKRRTVVDRKRGRRVPSRPRAPQARRAATR